MHTNESAENYLETILILSKSHPVVRSVDVAAELGFKKSSVSVAMKSSARQIRSLYLRKDIFIWQNPVLLPQRKSTSVIFSFPSGLRSLALIRLLQQAMHARSNMWSAAKVLQRSRNILISTVWNNHYEVNGTELYRI